MRRRRRKLTKAKPRRKWGERRTEEYRYEKE
jgi:hypothetical protein